MDDLQKLMDAVTEMRAAQRLEMDALPGNFKVWKKTRQKMTVAQLEANVDALLKEMQRNYGETNNASDTMQE